MPEMGLYLLADGMGGARAGELASQMAVETVAEIWQVAASRCRRVAGCCGRSQPARSRRNPSAIHVSKVWARHWWPRWRPGERLAIASVGDSRAYLLEEGKLRAITEDQTWVHEVGRTWGWMRSA